MSVRIISKCLHIKPFVKGPAAFYKEYNEENIYWDEKNNVVKVKELNDKNLDFITPENYFRIKNHLNCIGKHYSPELQLVENTLMLSTASGKEDVQLIPSYMSEHDLFLNVIYTSKFDNEKLASFSSHVKLNSKSECTFHSN